MSGAGILGASTAYQPAKEGGAILRSLDQRAGAGGGAGGGARNRWSPVGSIDVRTEDGGAFGGLRLGESFNPIIRGHL